MRSIPNLYEKSLAAASFIVAAALAFIALVISDDHEIEAGVCMVIAQFLTLTGTIIGVNYKFRNYGHNNYTTGDSQQ